MATQKAFENVWRWECDGCGRMARMARSPTWAARFALSEGWQVVESLQLCTTCAFLQEVGKQLPSAKKKTKEPHP